MSKVLFKEEQKYLQGKGFFIVLPIWIGLLIGFVMIYLRQDHSMETTTFAYPAADVKFYLVMLIIFAAASVQTFIFSRLKLLIEVREEGIFFKYPPLIRKWKSLSFENIQSYAIREYRPRLEFSGHGIPRRKHRIRRRKWGVAYTAYGKTGLQLVLKDGEKILIGTQRATSLVHTLDKRIKEKQ